MKTNETLVCGDTGPDGTYSVPVIIGSRVDYIDVMFHNHRFAPLQTSVLQSIWVKPLFSFLSFFEKALRFFPFLTSFLNSSSLCCVCLCVLNFVRKFRHIVLQWRYLGELLKCLNVK